MQVVRWHWRSATGMPAASDLSGHGARAAACPSALTQTAVLTSLHPWTPQPHSLLQKPASLEVNKCPAGWDVFGNHQEFYWLMGWNIPICQIPTFQGFGLCSGWANFWLIYSAPTLFLRASLSLLYTSRWVTSQYIQLLQISGFK